MVDVMGGMADVGAGQEPGSVPVVDSYGRLSRVPETGELEKIETQHADNRETIKRHGYRLGLELDDGLSAWKRGVVRKDWERLLERVQAGHSQGVAVWHTDRLFRQPRDLEALIDLADAGFVVLSSHGRYDLSDPNDRFILRIEVAHAARSSDDTQRRIKRRFNTFREQGRGHIGGPRPFGFAGLEAPGQGTGPKGKRLPVPAEWVERERQAIRDAAQALLAGVGQGTIATEWNKAGLRSAAGREWVTISVRALMLRATNAGLIEHDGVVVGRMEGEPILDEATFGRLRAMYAGRRRGRVVGEHYVGTGILRCGLCGFTLSASKKNTTYKDTGQRRAIYFCNKQRRGCGKVYADMRAVDAELRTLTIRRLSDSRHAAAISEARARVSARLSAVETEIRICEEYQKALSDRLGRRELTLDAFDAANVHLVRDLARLREERDSLTGGAPTGPIRALSAEQVAAEWDSADVAGRRAMLTRALGRQRLVIDPAQRGGKRVFDKSRLHFDNAKTPGEAAALQQV